MTDERCGDTRSRRWAIVLSVLGGGFVVAGLVSFTRGVGGVVGGTLWILTGLVLVPWARHRMFAVVARGGGPDLCRYGTTAVVVLVATGAALGGAAVPVPGALDTGGAGSVAPDADDASSVTDAESWTVTVVEVIDGDTMDVRLPDGSVERVRLLGVDAPEATTARTTPHEWAGLPDTASGRAWLVDWSGEATTYAERRLAGREVFVEVDPAADRRGGYGRLLVYVYQNESSDRSFNRRLVENGYARVYESPFSQRTAFERVEAEARAAETGLWGYGFGDERGIVVDEIHEDARGPDGDNLDDEYIVLRNTDEHPRDIGGWEVVDTAGHTYVVPDGFRLDAGATVTIRTGTGTNSETTLYWGRSQPVWNNGGDTVVVRDAAGNTVLETQYD